MKTNYQILLSKRDPAPLFEKWRGARAYLSGYVSSHRVLEIRTHREWGGGYLCVLCADVRCLSGPTKWDGSHLELERIGEDRVILRDRGANFEVHAGIVGAAELPEN